MEEFDVIVVGGGPSGAACASLLGRAGKTVLLLDKAKFPRDKICGDSICGKSMRVIRELGIQEEIEKVQQEKNRGIIIVSPKGDVVDVRKPVANEVDFQGYICKRELFDNIIFQNSRKYAKIIEEFTVTDIIREGENVIGVKGNDSNGQEKEYRAKITVGADGAQSILASKLGVGEFPPEHTAIAIRAYFNGVEYLKPRLEAYFFSELMPGYFWIFPTGGTNGEANVGLGILFKEKNKRKINLEEMLNNLIKTHPLLKDRFKHAKQEGKTRGWILPLASKPRKMVFDGCVLIGDAAGLIDPFTGDGIGNGLTSASIASKIIIKSLDINDNSKNFLKEYQVKLFEYLGNELKASYSLQKKFKYKFILNFLIGRLKSSQELRELLAGTFLNDYPTPIKFTPKTIWNILTAR